MSDVSGVTTSTTTTSTTSSSSTTSDFSEEYNSFLQLLTTQIQNQDPLEPMDSTQFVEQLATFSALEQQINTNSNLESISSLISGLQSNLMASEWLGESVTLDTSSVPYSGDPVEFTVDVPDSVDEVVLTVSSSSGAEVWSQTLDPDADSYLWSGETSAGDLADDDTYVFEVEMYQDGELVRTSSPSLITSVTGVGTDDDGTMVVSTALGLTADMSGVAKYYG